MKNKMIVFSIVAIILISCVSCRTPVVANNTGTWKIYFCVSESQYRDIGEYMLLKTGVEVTEQDEIASYLSLLDSAAKINKQIWGHFCGAETFQVFESNSVPVFVTSISGCGTIKKNKILQVDKFKYGYYLGKTESCSFECLPYYEVCHRIFEDAVIAEPEYIVSSYARNHSLSQIGRFRCRFREFFREIENEDNH